LTHPEIKEAVVLPRESKNGDNSLCAYYVVESNPTPELDTGVSSDSRAHLSESALRTYLTQYLPDYMNPAFFIKLEKIPLTANGKIDGKALTRLKISRSEFQEDYVAPKSETEIALAHIWAEILDMEKNTISINTNFFQLGGHSLKATMMMAKIQEKMAAVVPLSKIFRTPTI
ncbi:MAG: hypothetical protein GY757_28535, partial [bacterium]|nr:hypothetical protein [bacterium]